MKKRRKDFEIRFYEGLINDKPNFVQALASLGDAYTRRGFYQEGLEIDQRLVRLKPEDPLIHYNLACSLSLLGKTDEALEQLKQAVLRGYGDIAYLLKDPDLEQVRQSPAFKKFIAKLKQTDTK